MPINFGIANCRIVKIRLIQLEFKNKIICMHEASVTLHGFVVSRSMYYNLSINFSSNSTKQMAFDEIIIYTRIYDTLNQPSDFSNVTTATPSLNNRTLSTSPPPFLFFWKWIVIVSSLVEGERFLTITLLEGMSWWTAHHCGCMSLALTLNALVMLA